MGRLLNRVDRPPQGPFREVEHTRQILPVNPKKWILTEKDFFAMRLGMAQNQEIIKEPRANITLTGDIVLQLEKNKAAIEERLGIKVTMAFVIKLAIREQASVEKAD